MNTERILSSGQVSQKTLDALQMAEWVYELAAWQVISHLTFSWEASLEAGRRAYEKFMRKHLPQVSYFYALEENPSRDGFHVHALWADARGVFRKEAWAAWFEKYGRARIEPVRDKGDVSGYCAKYVTKERAWWNVKLQWYRVQAINGSGFCFDGGGPVVSGAPLVVETEERAAQSEPVVSEPVAWVHQGDGVWIPKKLDASIAGS